MEAVNEILQLIEDGKMVPDQARNILQFILSYSKSTAGYVCTVVKKKRLKSSENPEGIYYKILACIGEIDLIQDNYTTADYIFKNQITRKYCLIPMIFDSKFLGQICLAGAKDDYTFENITHLNKIYRIIGKLVYYENIDRERKQLLEERDLSKAKSMFMANISHEIRTPLNSILGSLDYFSEIELTRAGRDVLEVMKHSSFNLLYLVNDILDISGLESNKITMHLAPANFKTIIEDAYRIVHEGKSKHVSFQHSVDTEIPQNVITDSQRVKQIIINLLSNAFKFTERGHVKLKVSHATQEDLDQIDLPPIEMVSLTPTSSQKTARINPTDNYSYRKGSIADEYIGSKRYIKISVSDTGIGIKDSDIGKLFKSFSQVDSSTTKKYGGTGLGLAISYGFCKLLQGDIGLISEWKKGTTFYFIIPIQEYRTNTDDVIDIKLLVGKHALIVDDKVDNIVRLTNILDKYAIEYTTTTSARHAIAIFINAKKIKFDLGLIDVYMPEMDGNELANYITKTETPFPLIALSSADNKLNDITGSFDYTLTKPYSEEQIIKCIYNILKIKNEIAPDPSKVQFRTGRRISNESIGEPNITQIPKNKPYLKDHSMSKLFSTERPNQNKINDDDFKANTNISIKILVVEDNQYNQFTILRMLNSLGYYNIDVVNSGKHAIKMIKSNKETPLSFNSKKTTDKSYFDVILMDIIMPDMDGIQASLAIKKLFKSSSLCPKIIAVTANVTAGSSEKCFTVDKMDGFIEKPINKAILADVIAKISS